MPAPLGEVVDVWWSDLRSVDARLFALLDPRESARLEAMERAADRGRFTLGAALLRIAVGAATGVDPRSVGIERTCAECGGPHGAPRVTGARVSVAHAGPLVLVGTCAVGVGVDVEALARGRDVEGWVVDEARFKTGVGPAEQVTTMMLGAPLTGYVAALAVAGTREPQVAVHDLEESAAALERLAKGGRAAFP